MENYEKVKELLTVGDLEGSCQLLTAFIEGQRSLERPEWGRELTDAFNTRGHIRYLWVDFDEAVEDYTEAIKRDPEFAVAYYNRGQVHYRLGRYKLAEKDLSRALELNPGFTDAQLNLNQVETDLRNSHKFNEADQFREEEETV